MIETLLNDIEVVLVAGGILVGIALWARNKYKTMMADGKITLDELLDVIDEAKDKAEEAEEQLEVIEETLSKYKVSELKSMLKEKGLPVSGTKAELIERLEASE